MSQEELTLQYHFKFGVAFIIIGSLALVKETVFLSAGIALLSLGVLITLSSIYIAFIRGKAANSHYCRKPLKPFLSYILSFHIAHSFILDALYIFLIISSLPSQLSLWPLWQLIAVNLLIATISRFMLVNGTIRHLKWCLDSKFNIIIFRKFYSGHEDVNRILIAPTFGAYGRIISVRDESLLNAKAGPNEDSESVLGEPYESIRCEENNWKERVSMELKNADLAVFHWPDLPTDNLAWEFQEAMKWLPKERLIWVCTDETYRNVERWLQSTGLNLQDIHMIVVKEKAGAYKYFSQQVYNKLKSFEITAKPLAEG